METILDTVQLTYESNEYLLDLMRHKTGAKYIKVTHTALAGTNTGGRSEIKISPVAIDDMIEVLEAYRKKFHASTTGLLSAQQKKDVVSAYMKGVPLNELTLRYTCDQAYLENVLFNRGIEFTEEKGYSSPKPKAKKYRGRK